MNNYIRNGLKVLYNYALSLIVFGVFIYVFLTMAGNSFGRLLPIYSFAMFLLAFFIIYSDMKRLAIKERKPQYDMHPYPFKGLIYGFIGFLPIAVLEILSVFINFGSEFYNHLEHLAVNSLMGPMYFIFKAFDEKPLGYALATLVIPVLAMLGYLAGYYDINIIRRAKKQESKTAVKGFEKSPWNPTNGMRSTSGKKKKKTTKTV